MSGDAEVLRDLPTEAVEARRCEAILLSGGLDTSIVATLAQGLREVAARGMRSCWTGDGADELFAGYSFMFERPPEEIERIVRRHATTMRFNGPAIGAALGVDVHSPYLDPAVIAHAVTLPVASLVMEAAGRRMGKAPLRRAFSDVLPAEHTLRRKDPIEIGSGATALGQHAAASVGDAFAAEAARILAQDRVRIRDAEHLAYYRVYREVFGGPPHADPSLPKECPGCHARGPEGTYCTVCGAYPI